MIGLLARNKSGPEADRILKTEPGLAIREDETTDGSWNAVALAKRSFELM